MKIVKGVLGLNEKILSVILLLNVNTLHVK